MKAGMYPEANKNGDPITFCFLNRILNKDTTIGVSATTTDSTEVSH